MLALLLSEAVAGRQPHRTLYSAEEIGLLYAQSGRDLTFQTKANGDAEQASRYKDGVLAKFDGLTMREKAIELRHFIFLMNLAEDDIANVKVLLGKYEQAYFDSGPNQLQFLRFGADIMRTCHLLKEPRIALNVSKR